MLINCRADGLAPNAAGGEPNEDGIVGGPRTPQQIAAQKRLQQTQAQVDEVNYSDSEIKPKLLRPRVRIGYFYLNHFILVFRWWTL